MRTRLVVALVLVALLGVVGFAGAGCSQLTSRSDDGGDDPSETPGAASASPILVTRDWGVVDGMLSVVVQNTTDRTLHSADAVISARDDSDVLVASSLEGPSDDCCTLTDLPPGQKFGLYLDIGDSAAGISRVDVAYRDVAWVPDGQEATANPLVARPVRLDGNGSGAIVVADVRASVPMVSTASVQAFLDGPDGRFLAVVAGRWYCFSRGSHEIRMQLEHPVPAGTTVESVVVHPVADDPDGAATNCAGPAQTG